MVQNTFRFGTVGDDIAGGWLPVVMRAVVVFVLAPAAASKFLIYSQRAANFVEYGIPAPEVTVLLVGVVEIVAVVMIAVGAAGRLGALVMIPVMVTAILLAGVNSGNALVLVGCIGIVAFGTGNYSVWEPFRSVSEPRV